MKIISHDSQVDQELHPVQVVQEVRKLLDRLAPAPLKSQGAQEGQEGLAGLEDHGAPDERNHKVIKVCEKFKTLFII